MKNLSSIKVALLGCLLVSSPLAVEEAAAAAVKFLCGSDNADEFPYDGEGWDEPWQVRWPKEYEKYLMVETTAEKPLTGTSRRLEVRPLVEEGSPSRPISFHMDRKVDAAALDTLKPYTVAFKLRVDASEQIDQTGLSVAGQPEDGDWGPSDSVWDVRIQKGYWYVVGQTDKGDVGEDGKKALRFERLPLRVEPETTYSFLVHVDPAGGTYRVQISDGTDEVESPELRSANPKAMAKVQFRGEVDEGNPFVFSLAGLEISHVP